MVWEFGDPLCLILYFNHCLCIDLQSAVLQDLFSVIDTVCVFVCPPQKQKRCYLFFIWWCNWEFLAWWYSVHWSKESQLLNIMKKIEPWLCYGGHWDGQKVEGDASESPPQEFSYVAIVHIKRYTKNYKCVIISEKGALISAWKCT